MKKAFVKYNNGKLVSSVLLLLERMPSETGWMEVPSTFCCTNVGTSASIARMKGWIKFSAAGDVVPGSTIIRSKRPKDGLWMEIPYTICC